MSSDRVKVERSRLRWRDTVTESVAALAQRPVRTLLTALGTLLGVGAFVTTNALAETARAQVSSRFDALKATEVRVQDAAPDGTNPFPDDVGARLGRLNGVNDAGLLFTVPDDGSIEARATAARALGVNTQPVPVIGADSGAVQAALPVLSAGRLYDGFHEGRSERVAVLGRVAADQLGVLRLDNQPVVFLGDRAYTVIGILDDVARSPDLLLSIVIPASTAADDFRVDSATFEVLIDTRPGAAQLIGGQAPLALRPADPGRLQSLVPPDPRTLRNQVTDDVTSLFLALSGLALFIGMVAITNATLLNTIERRGEIGLRRALGATRAHIARQITLEAAATGLIAGVIGTAIGLSAVSAVAISKGWTVTVNPTLLLIAPAAGLVTGALAGVIPAWRASNTPPAETLRS